MNEQICTRCKISKDLSFFQGKNKSFKLCKLCRDKGKLYYQQNKENNDPDPIDHNEKIYNSKEMSTAIKELIYSVGQEEYIENLEHGIAFIQTITIEDFDGSEKEIADNIKNIICENDGYYYM
jgi:hypothetical protein